MTQNPDLSSEALNNRYLKPVLAEHLKKYRQMAFIVGPRQVGKTTLAQSFLDPLVPGTNSFNWDVPAQRKLLIKEFFQGKKSLKGETQSIVVFDEIHKYPRWKNALKGLFDTHQPNTHWIVTGSAALNVYRKGQDSLLGRYFTYHLFPFSVAELLPSNALSLESFLKKPVSKNFHGSDRFQKSLDQLNQYSGFPEPFFKTDKSFLTRWRTSRLDRLVNQDLASTESLRNLPLVEHLMTLLPERVGNPLSFNNLREDLEIHFATVKQWMKLLERVFYGFILTPYSKKSTRMLRKEPKWYLWDWTEIDDPGARFENLVAVHLFKYVSYINDLGLGELSLRYVRDKQKCEIDFLICQKKKPWILVECKLTNESPSPNFKKFAEILGVKHCFQITQEDIQTTSFHINNETNLIVMPAASFLSLLV